MILIVTASIIVLATFIMIVNYNMLIRRKNEVENAFGSIDIMLKKRYDLIPNLVEITKQYMKHEQTVFIDITRLRTLVNEDSSEEDRVNTHNELHRKVKDLMVNVENYPELKADKSFLNLQANWTSSEEQISAARRYYNTAVTDYNNFIQMFPSNIYANMFGYSKKEVLQIEKTERNNIKASELFK